MAGFFRMVRAMATRCFSPPDSFSPRSPTCVIALGQAQNEIVDLAQPRAPPDLGSVASMAAIGDVVADASLNSTVSCGTMPMARRRDCPA
jgi:hypothetical protein